MRRIPSIVDEQHPDYVELRKVRDAILARAGGHENLRQALPVLIKDAVDFVVDPVRTGRTRIADLDNVEKTFIGLKIEHFVRDLLDVPTGLRDLVVDGRDVDIKNTVSSTWMIPPETYRTEDPCLLIASAEDEGLCWLGLLMARSAYLTKPNRDGKRAVSAAGSSNIMWIVDAAQSPVSRWAGIDMIRFRELRKMPGGTNRAATFFRENVGKPIHRSIIQALLHDQRDYMKRVRGNGGARDILEHEGLLVLSGAFDAKRAHQLGFALARDEFMTVAVS